MSNRPTWTPYEVKLLRDLQHLSQRAFAHRLGYAQSTVVGWERTERTTPLHHETTEVLDVELTRLAAEQREMFDRERGLSPGRLGAGSAARTTALLTAIADTSRPLPYIAPDDAVNATSDFLLSTARALLVTGPAGTGKTCLTRHLAHHFADQADFQLLTVDSVAPATAELAADILRYASIARGDDALLTLEEHSSRLSRPCIVVIDGLATQEAFSTIGRQIELILRQVITRSLRFLLTVRTPPAIETTAHPVLHASLHQQATSPRDIATTQQLTPWSAAQARAAWNDAATSPFDALPPGVQHLVRTPLYMSLALDAPPTARGADLSAYALLEHCVRRLLGAQHSEHRLASLARLAVHDSPGEIPAALSGSPGNTGPTPALPVDIPVTVARINRHQHVEFSHDILREFFVSTHIAELMHDQGRSVASVQAFNELAHRAVSSSTARSVFELVLQHLDARAPTLLEAIATAPSAALTSTVPLMISVADQARFLTPEVLRGCASRADHDQDPALSRALLHHPHLRRALGPGCRRWLLGLLRTFGATLWPDITAFIEEHFDTADAHALLDLANLARGDEATFFARHFYLFFADTTSTLEVFLGHDNWRVRAALAEAVGDPTAMLHDTGPAVLARLIHDTDYKVRAAVAPVIVQAPSEVAAAAIRTLLHDNNWHVRDRVLHGLNGLDPRSHRPDLIRTALAITANDPTWSRAPAHIRPSRDRLRILHTPGDTHDPPHATTTVHHDQRAWITVLRELRTRHLKPTDPHYDQLINTARHSDHWLVRREADRAAAVARQSEEPLRASEQFRRHRGQRRVQIALDLHDITDALHIARAAADAGADCIEIGDPLIKAAGIRAIEHVKAAVGDTHVLAEMMSADWGRDQVLLAVQAGADIVQLIGPSTSASVRAAVEAGRRLDVAVTLDVPLNTNHRWIADMERAGIDGLTVTTNIDIGIGSTAPLDVARHLRSWTELPVAVSGGFSTTDTAVFTNPNWDILIVGRSVIDAVDPATAVHHLVELIHFNRKTP